MRLAKTGRTSTRNSVGGVGIGTQADNEEVDLDEEDELDIDATVAKVLATQNYDDALRPVAPPHVQTHTALMQRRRRVCSCSSQTDLKHVPMPYSPTPGTGSPTASLLGFNILGR